MRPRYPIWLRGLLVTLVPALLILLTFMNYQLALQSSSGNDFLVGWTSAKRWIEEGISPYDPALREALQHSIYGRPANPEAGEFQGYFVPPPPALLIYTPFSLLSFEFARSLWMTFAEIGLLLLVVIGHRLVQWHPNRFLLIGLLLFSLFWYYGAYVIVMGSLSFIVAILVLGAILAIRKDNDWVAGLMLVFSLIQPHLSSIVVAFVLIWGLSKRRWQLNLSLLGFLVLSIGASTFISPTWAFEWVRQSIDLLNSPSISSGTMILSAQFPNISSWVQVGISIVLGLYLLWEWIQALGKDIDWFTWTASMTLAISMLVIPHFSSEGMLLLLPILVMLFGHWIGRWGPGGQIGAWLTIALLGPILWYLSSQESAPNREHPVLFLLLPIFCILGLLWVRWWVTTRQRGFLRST